LMPILIILLMIILILSMLEIISDLNLQSRDSIEMLRFQQDHSH
jgi:hypothetical protein